MPSESLLVVLIVVKYSFFSRLWLHLEIVDSDFVPQLVKTAKESNGFRSFEYSIPPRLLDLIQEYNRGMLSQHRHFSFALDGDLRECRGDIREMLHYYHNLREMYRFTQDYDLRRSKLDEHTKMVEEKKEAAKQKKLGSSPYEQLTLFDYLNSQK